jgi:hypothetical protein
MILSFFAIAANAARNLAEELAFDELKQKELRDEVHEEVRSDLEAQWATIEAGIRKDLAAAHARQLEEVVAKTIVDTQRDTEDKVRKSEHVLSDARESQMAAMYKQQLDDRRIQYERELASMETKLRGDIDDQQRQRDRERDTKRQEEWNERLTIKQTEWSMAETKRIEELRQQLKNEWNAKEKQLQAEFDERTQTLKQSSIAASDGATAARVAVEREQWHRDADIALQTREHELKQLHDDAIATIQRDHQSAMEALQLSHGQQLTELDTQRRRDRETASAAERERLTDRDRAAQLRLDAALSSLRDELTSEHEAREVALREIHVAQMKQAQDVMRQREEAWRVREAEYKHQQSVGKWQTAVANVHSQHAKTAEQEAVERAEGERKLAREHEAELEERLTLMEQRQIDREKDIHAQMVKRLDDDEAAMLASLRDMVREREARIRAQVESTAKAIRDEATIEQAAELRRLEDNHTKLVKKLREQWEAEALAREEKAKQATFESTMRAAEVMIAKRVADREDAIRAEVEASLGQNDAERERLTQGRVRIAVKEIEERLKAEMTVAVTSAVNEANGQAALKRKAMETAKVMEIEAARQEWEAQLVTREEAAKEQAFEATMKAAEATIAKRVAEREAILRIEFVEEKKRIESENTAKVAAAEAATAAATAAHAKTKQGEVGHVHRVVNETEDRLKKVHDERVAELHQAAEAHRSRMMKDHATEREHAVDEAVKQAEHRAKQDLHQREVVLLRESDAKVKEAVNVATTKLIQERDDEEKKREHDAKVAMDQQLQRAVADAVAAAEHVSQQKASQQMRDREATLQREADERLRDAVAAATSRATEGMAATEQQRITDTETRLQRAVDEAVANRDKLATQTLHQREAELRQDGDVRVRDAIATTTTQLIAEHTVADQKRAVAEATAADARLQRAVSDAIRAAETKAQQDLRDRETTLTMQHEANLRDVITATTKRVNDERDTTERELNTAGDVRLKRAIGDATRTAESKAAQQLRDREAILLQEANDRLHDAVAAATLAATNQGIADTKRAVDDAIATTTKRINNERDAAEKQRHHDTDASVEQRLAKAVADAVRSSENKAAQQLRDRESTLEREANDRIIAVEAAAAKKAQQQIDTATASRDQLVRDGIADAEQRLSQEHATQRQQYEIDIGDLRAQVESLKLIHAKAEQQWKMDASTRESDIRAELGRLSDQRVVPLQQEISQLQSQITLLRNQASLDQQRVVDATNRSFDQRLETALRERDDAHTIELEAARHAAEDNLSRSVAQADARAMEALQSTIQVRIDEKIEEMERQWVIKERKLVGDHSIALRDADERHRESERIIEEIKTKAIIDVRRECQERLDRRQREANQREDERELRFKASLKENWTLREEMTVTQREMERLNRDIKQHLRTIEILEQRLKGLHGHGKGAAKSGQPRLELSDQEIEERNMRRSLASLHRRIDSLDVHVWHDDDDEIPVRPIASLVPSKKSNGIAPAAKQAPPSKPTVITPLPPTKQQPPASVPAKSSIVTSVKPAGTSNAEEPKKSPLTLWRERRALEKQQETAGVVSTPAANILASPPSSSKKAVTNTLSSTPVTSPMTTDADSKRSSSTTSSASALSSSLPVSDSKTSANGPLSPMPPAKQHAKVTFVLPQSSVASTSAMSSSSSGSVTSTTSSVVTSTTTTTNLVTTTIVVPPSPSQPTPLASPSTYGSSTPTPVAAAVSGTSAVAIATSSASSVTPSPSLPPLARPPSLTRQHSPKLHASSTVSHLATPSPLSTTVTPLASASTAPTPIAAITTTAAVATNAPRSSTPVDDSTTSSPPTAFVRAPSGSRKIIFDFNTSSVSVTNTTSSTTSQPATQLGPTPAKVATTTLAPSVVASSSSVVMAPQIPPPISIPLPTPITTPTAPGNALEFVAVSGTTTIVVTTPPPSLPPSSPSQPLHHFSSSPSPTSTSPHGNLTTSSSGTPFANNTPQGSRPTTPRIVSLPITMVQLEPPIVSPQLSTKRRVSISLPSALPGISETGGIIPTPNASSSSMPPTPTVSSLSMSGTGVSIMLPPSPAISPAVSPTGGARARVSFTPTSTSVTPLANTNSGTGTGGTLSRSGSSRNIISLPLQTMVMESAILSPSPLHTRHTRAFTNTTDSPNRNQRHLDFQPNASGNSDTTTVTTATTTTTTTSSSTLNNLSVSVLNFGASPTGTPITSPSVMITEPNSPSPMAALGGSALVSSSNLSSAAATPTNTMPPPSHHPVRRRPSVPHAPAIIQWETPPAPYLVPPTNTNTSSHHGHHHSISSVSSMSSNASSTPGVSPFPSPRPASLIIASSASPSPSITPMANTPLPPTPLGPVITFSMVPPTPHVGTAPITPMNMNHTTNNLTTSSRRHVVAYAIPAPAPLDDDATNNNK